MSSSADLYRAICDAILEDGQVDPWETRLMRDVVMLLGLDQSEALSIFSERRKAARGAGGDVHARRLELYSELIRAIAHDGAVDNLEKSAVVGLRRALNISDDEHRVVVQKQTGS